MPTTACSRSTGPSCRSWRRSRGRPGWAWTRRWGQGSGRGGTAGAGGGGGGGGRPATTLRLVRAENPGGPRLAVKGPYLEWTQTDTALPLPISFKDAGVELGEMAGAGLEALDQQVLKITGLFAGRYEVLIDGASVGRFSQAELATGVNFAKEDEPMYKQALPVRWAGGDRHELQLARRRVLLGAGKDPTMGAGAGALANPAPKAQQGPHGGPQPPAPPHARGAPFS